MKFNRAKLDQFIEIEKQKPYTFGETDCVNIMLRSIKAAYGIDLYHTVGLREDSSWAEKIAVVAEQFPDMESLQDRVVLELNARQITLNEVNVGDLAVKPGDLIGIVYQGGIMTASHLQQLRKIPFHSDFKYYRIGDK